MTLLRYSLILLLVTTIAACGFQLRGSQRALNKSFSSVNLIANGKDFSFYNAVKRGLADSGISVNEGSINHLEIIGTQNQRRTASYSSRAKSAEFELIKTVVFQFSREDQRLIAPMKLEARRSYLYRETAAVGKAEEENLLREEMDKDLAQRILLAMQRVADVQSEAAANEITP